MVNIYDNDGEIIGTVKYNQNLDIWNGSNNQNGGVGRHLGITKVNNGKFVLIYGSDWQGDSDYAEIVSDRTAFQKIKKFNPDLLDEDKFKELKRFEKDLLVEVD